MPCCQCRQQPLCAKAGICLEYRRLVDAAESCAAPTNEARYVFLRDQTDTDMLRRVIGTPPERWDAVVDGLMGRHGRATAFGRVVPAASHCVRVPDGGQPK
jgi:hypothetical protein